MNRREAIIGSEILEVVVDPRSGAELLEVRHRPTGKQLLFTSPWAERAERLRRGHMAPSSNSSGGRWLEHYRGGWQTLFPNPGGERTVAGSEYGFHGEASLTDWQLEVDTPQMIEVHTALFSVPLTLSRRIMVENQSVTVVDQIHNPAPVRVFADYSQHVAFGGDMLDGDCIISVGECTFVNDHEAPTAGVAPGSRHPWPLVERLDGSVLDISRISPCEKRLVFGWLTDLSEQTVTIHNGSSGLQAALSWDDPRLDQVWVWQELGSTVDWPWYGRARAVAIEPATTTSSGPDRDELATIEPEKSIQFSVTLRVDESSYI